MSVYFLSQPIMAPSPINPASTASPTIRRTLRYVEWTFLVAISLFVLISRFVAPDSDAYEPRKIFVTLAFILSCALLSFIFPINRPLWQRRAYILLEILLIITTRLSDWNLEVFLYLFLAKSCFLLKRKDVLITALAAGIAWEFALLWSLPGTIEFLCDRSDDLCNPKRIIFIQIISDITSYLTASTFVILLSLVAIAEQKSRLKAEALARKVEILAATLERTRIARDIHDSLGHTLTTLDVQLELAQRLHQRNPDKALQAVNTAKSLASQSLADVRRALQTMRDSDFDLNKALTTLIEQVKQNQPFNIQLHMNLPKLPLQTSYQLYCIVQEGLTNIQKHAHASQVRLWSQPTVDGIILKLEDNSVGFEPGLPHSGFGLRGMRSSGADFGRQA